MNLSVLTRQLTALPLLSLLACTEPQSPAETSESLRPSQIFHVNTPNPGHACGLTDPQECVRAFHNPLWTSHSPAFPLSFWSVYCFCLTLKPPLQEAVTLAIADVCFWQMPQRKWLFSLGKLQVRSNREKTYEWGLPRNYQTGQIMIILSKWSFEGAASSFYSIQWLPDYCFYTTNVGCWSS